jgi:transposase
MADNSRDRLALACWFLEPSNSTNRRYEALRVFFVDGLTSAEVAARFGYTPGSFRVLIHQFRDQPGREFFLPSTREARPFAKQQRLRKRVVIPRKQNLSGHAISRALAREGTSLSPRRSPPSSRKLASGPWVTA